MLYDNEATEDTDAETTEEDVTINGERKIPGRQKVVRGSNVQVFNFARGSESPFETRFIAGRQSASGDGEHKFVEPLSLTASLVSGKSRLVIFILVTKA